MSDDSAAPPDQPARAAVVCDDVDARARGVATRKRTIRKTMFAANGRQPSDDAEHSVTPAPAPRRRASPKLVPRRAVQQTQLIARITLLIARQLDVIDEILLNTESTDPRRLDAERHARAVAVLCRVLAELRKYQGDEQGTDDDDDRPASLDDLRERLSRRLGERLGRAETQTLGVDDAGGDELSG